MRKMKKFENIVIASDLDGTFFGTKQYLIERNLERIKYFCDNGGYFTFATGRLPLFIKKPIPDPLSIINMPAVMGNGTCIYDFEKQEAIEEHFIDSEIAINVIKYAKELDGTLGTRATFPGGFAISDMDNPIDRREYERLPGFMEKRILPLDEWRSLNCYKVNIISTDKEIDRIYPILKEKFSDKVGIAQTASFMIEVFPLGVSKARGLQGLIESYFDRKMTLCCVGDYDNDLEMLRFAHIAVCPSNANENVKAISKYCLCSNDEGIIGDLIDRLDADGTI